MLVEKFNKLSKFDKGEIIDFIKDIHLSENFAEESDTDKEIVLGFLSRLTDAKLDYLCDFGARDCKQSIHNFKK